MTTPPHGIPLNHSWVIQDMPTRFGEKLCEEIDQEKKTSKRTNTLQIMIVWLIWLI